MKSLTKTSIQISDFTQIRDAHCLKKKNEQTSPTHCSCLHMQLITTTNHVLKVKSPLAVVHVTLWNNFLDIVAHLFLKVKNNMQQHPPPLRGISHIFSWDCQYLVLYH